ncbi:MAG: hypothetical protein Greene041619_26 [Candidatus Peregrinibacteria bacterium Greene0416_19]|nr:MAG: hypothetical protein Greene041619_26 [Candidatus Peregrinibacteria bacterium Greene0416_19]
MTKPLPSAGVLLLSIFLLSCGAQPISENTSSAPGFDFSREPVSFTYEPSDRNYGSTLSKRVELMPFTGKDLAAMWGCGDAVAGQYDGLTAMFAGAQKTIYSVAYVTGNVARQTDAALQPKKVGTYELALYPNMAGYQDVAAFQNQFPPCGAGGPHPVLVSRQWLVFEHRCYDIPMDGMELCDELTAPAAGSVRLR